MLTALGALSLGDFLAAMALGLVGLGLLGMLLPLRALRFVVGIGLAHAGVALLLVLLAAASEGWLGTSGVLASLSAGSAAVIAARAPGLALAAIVFGVLAQALALMILTALSRKGETLDPEVITTAAEAQWRAFLGESAEAPTRAARPRRARAG